MKSSAEISPILILTVGFFSSSIGRCKKITTETEKGKKSIQRLNRYKYYNEYNKKKSTTNKIQSTTMTYKIRFVGSEQAKK